MGNRCFLYVVSPGDEDAEEIADANNLFPSLWQLLLADGQSAAAIEDQRVFGDAGTANIATRGESALARFEQVSAWLRRHPSADSIPGLGRYLDAAARHLHSCLDSGEGPSGDAPLLSANLDELSWLDSESPDQFIADTLAQCRTTWSAVERMIEAGTYEDLEEVLGFREWNVGFGDWKAWSTVFGLSLFSHPYFFGTWDEPRTEAFEDFDEEEDAAAGDTWLGAGCERFKEGDRWGVRAVADDGKPEQLVSPAQWGKDPFRRGR